MIEKTFCPIINGACRNDCVFYKGIKTATPNGISDCLLVIKVSLANDMQHDQLTEIINAIDK